MTMLRLVLLVCVAATHAFAARPNIVFIMADDLGWNDVGYHGGKARTPNIDALAERGVKLERFYAYPMCNPARIALMSGLQTVAVVNRVAEEGLPQQSLPLDVKTLPEVFRAAGYQTFMMGKWHIGREHIDYFAHNRGFDHFYGFLNAGIDFYSHIARGGLDWQRNGKSVREEGYSTDLFTEEAIKMLKTRDKNKPSFLYVAYNAVHAPLQAPPAAVDQYANVSNRNKRIYYAMTTRMDDGIGRILQTLEGEGMADNTLVVFVSDNGGAWVADNSPLRGGKVSTFEGGIRVPGVIYMPGALEGGRESQQFVTMHDWLPTLAAAADVPVKHVIELYGKDLWAALRDDKVIENRDFLLGHRGNFAVFEKEWKLVRNNGETYLFRVEEDPSEKNDLKEMHPEIVERLSARIAGVERPGTIVQTSESGRRGGRGARGKRGGGRGGRGRSGAQTEETREPWAEAAARD